MATNPVPISELGLTTDSTPTEIIVHCTGKITSNTTQSLRATVKPLFTSKSETVVLDLTNVKLPGQFRVRWRLSVCTFRRKPRESQLKLINPNRHLKELFSGYEVGLVYG